MYRFSILHGGRNQPNLYAYVTNRPVNFVDPFGLQENPDTNLEECLDNCAEDRKMRALDYARKHVGARVIGYIVFSGAVVVGGLLCATPWGPGGIVLIIVGGAGDIIEWVHNSYEDAKFNKENIRKFNLCEAGCRAKYHE